MLWTQGRSGTVLRFAESMLDMSPNLDHRKLANRDGIYQWPVGAPIEAKCHQLNHSFYYIQPTRIPRAWKTRHDPET